MAPHTATLQVKSPEPPPPPPHHPQPPQPHPPPPRIPPPPLPPPCPLPLAPLPHPPDPSNEEEPIEPLQRACPVQPGHLFLSLDPKRRYEGGASEGEASRLETEDEDSVPQRSGANFSPVAFLVGRENSPIKIDKIGKKRLVPTYSNLSNLDLDELFILCLPVGPSHAVQLWVFGDFCWFNFVVGLFFCVASVLFKHRLDSEDSSDATLMDPLEGEQQRCLWINGEPQKATILLGCSMSL